MVTYTPTTEAATSFHMPIQTIVMAFPMAMATTLVQMSLAVQSPIKI